jgi:hypothetical protein
MKSTLRADMARMASMQLPWVIASPVICDSAGLADAAHALLMDGNEPKFGPAADGRLRIALETVDGPRGNSAARRMRQSRQPGAGARIDPPTRDRCKAWHSARAGAAWYVSF